jgi:hypothetical protein
VFDSPTVSRLAALVLLTGCASVGGVQTANTGGRGTLEIGVEPGVQLLGGSPGVQLYPHLDAAVRYGVTDKLDVGLRAGWSGLEAQTKYMLTDPAHTALAISVAPSLGGVILTSNSANLDVLGGILTAATPVLFGVGIGPHQLVLGLRSQHFMFIGGASTGPVYVLAVGGSLGFAVRFSDTLTLLPELAAVWPVYGGLPVTMTGDGLHADYLYGATQTGIFQFKLGFLLERRTARSRSGN